VLIGDMNFTCVLYKIDRNKIKTDDVYGEVVEDGIKFLPLSNLTHKLALPCLKIK
jgi:hypothetical protein